MPHQKIVSLQQSLEQIFPVNYQSADTAFEFYPVSNENAYHKVIKHLEQMQVTSDESHIRVCILFGESNFLSMLPTLIKFADVIVMADIEPKLHKHTTLMLESFRKAETPEQFLAEYVIKDPIPNFVPPDADNDFQGGRNTLKETPKKGLKSYLDRLFGKRSISDISLRKYHFLSDQARYNECKRALEQLSIIHINFDLTDIISCNTLSELLKNYNAHFTLCNFTNIHNYVDTEKLRAATSTLLQESDESIVMYTQGPKHNLSAYFSIGLTDYFSGCLGTHTGQATTSRKNQSKLLFFPASEKLSTSSVCYFALADDHVNRKSPELIQRIIEGKCNINAISCELHAFDTYEEAEQFAIELLKHEKIDHERENAYWIFTIRGHSSEINPLLRYRDSKFVWQHYPIDMEIDGEEAMSRVIKVNNNANTVVIEKPPLSSPLTRIVTNYFVTVEAKGL